MHITDNYLEQHKVAGHACSITSFISPSNMSANHRPYKDLLATRKLKSDARNAPNQLWYKRFVIVEDLRRWILKGMTGTWTVKVPKNHNTTQDKIIRMRQNATTSVKLQFKYWENALIICTLTNNVLFPLELKCKFPVPTADMDSMICLVRLRNSDGDSATAHHHCHCWHYLLLEPLPRLPSCYMIIDHKVRSSKATKNDFSWVDDHPCPSR